jgi:hypothetical protein
MMNIGVIEHRRIFLVALGLEPLIFWQDSKGTAQPMPKQR